MRLIIILFSEKVTAADPVVVAAITNMVQTLYPGAQITKVEEQI